MKMEEEECPECEKEAPEDVPVVGDEEDAPLETPEVEE